MASGWFGAAMALVLLTIAFPPEAGLSSFPVLAVESPLLYAVEPDLTVKKIFIILSVQLSCLETYVDRLAYIFCAVRPFVCDMWIGT